MWKANHKPALDYTRPVVGYTWNNSLDAYQNYLLSKQIAPAPKNLPRPIWVIPNIEQSISQFAHTTLYICIPSTVPTIGTYLPSEILAHSFLCQYVESNNTILHLQNAQENVELL